MPAAPDAENVPDEIPMTYFVTNSNSVVENVSDKVSMNYYDENKNYLSRLSGNLKFTTPANCAFIRVYFYNPNNMSVEQLPSYIQNIQIEQGSTATSYEPFVGGSPSPSPDYPQPVKVVTGDNTITIGDGTNSENYSINIGSIELCKIGDYQDYIYKSGDKWYKKAYIGKLVLDGSEENLIYNSTLNRLQMPFNLQTQDWVALALTLCNHFISGDTEIVDGSFNITRTTLYFKNIDLTSLNDWKTWLESNNTSVYYVLATPTNTEITDTDLIEQLETIRTAKSVENKTIISQTNADLPFIISASALSKN